MNADLNINGYTANDVLQLLRNGEHTRQEIREMTGWSNGRLYRLQVEAGLRKNEQRIRQRIALRRMQQEFLEASLNETVTGDVLDFLEGLPDESVNAVISSPPYNIGASYVDNPVGDSMRPLRYFSWMCAIIDEAERVLKPGGIVAFVVGGTRDRTGNIVPLDWVLTRAFEQTPLTFVNRVVWPTHAGPVPADRLAHRVESIMIYSKGPANFNPNAARVPQKEYDKRAYKGPHIGKATSHPHGAWPTDVWLDVKHIGNNHRESLPHPCQFPSAIPRRIMLLWTKPGDLVLDMFSGSGSTHAACIQTGRAFVGCDLAYGDMRKERLATVTPDLVTKLPGVTPESADFWQAELARERAGTAVWQARALPVRDDIEPITREQDRALVLDLFNDNAQAS